MITEKEYFERLCRKDLTAFDFWQEFSLKDLGNLARENYKNYERFLNGFDDEGLGHIAEYKTSKSKSVKNSFREISTHVLFHSMNHRGQINTAIRESGLSPPSIDYIGYRREIK